MDRKMKLRGIAFRWLNIRFIILVEQNIGLISAWNFDFSLEVIKSFYFFMVYQRFRRIAFKFSWRLCLFDVVLIL